MTAMNDIELVFEDEQGKLSQKDVSEGDPIMIRVNGTVVWDHWHGKHK